MKHPPHLAPLCRAQPTLLSGWSWAAVAGQGGLKLEENKEQGARCLSEQTAGGGVVVQW